MTGQQIFVIPDTQVRDGVPLSHLKAASNYIAEHQPDVIVHLGDHFDMPSLNKYASKAELEGKRILTDLKAGIEGMDLLFSSIKELQAKQRAQKRAIYKPRAIYLNGNHDPSVRFPRLCEEFPILNGMLEAPNMLDFGFTEEYPFLHIIDVAGIKFSHYFINPYSAKKAPLGGAIDTMLKNCGFSFVQGHTQTYKSGKHYLADGSVRMGIVAGAFYQHDEPYMGVQGNASHWRGCILLNEAKNGGADICELSLDYLLRKYL